MEHGGEDRLPHVVSLLSRIYVGRGKYAALPICDLTKLASSACSAFRACPAQVSVGGVLVRSPHLGAAKISAATCAVSLCVVFPARNARVRPSELP